MKNTLFIGCLAILLFSACAKKSKAEQLMDDASDGVTKVSKDVKEGAEDAADDTKSDRKKAKRKLKDIF